LGVLRGLDSFEERSALKTWLFRILVNRARSRGERESRTRPFSALSGADAEPVVDPDRFEATGRWAGFWSSPPSSQSIPEERVLAREAGGLLIAAIEELPPNQQIVISLRDVQGLDSTEVCEMLEISEGNQRVLLHRARGRVRAALEQYIDARELS
jgi:RNA polymerase sigma-70 factor (ECF subfamily)